MLAVATTNATQTNMSPTSNAESINQNNSSSIYVNDVEIYVVKQNSTEYAVLKRRVINRYAGLLSTQTIETDLISSGLSGISVSVTGGGTLIVKVTGLASTTLKWHAIINTKELSVY